MKVYVAQMKPFLGDIEKNAEKHFKIIDQAVEAGCDIVVFPELSLTGYYLLDHYYEVAINEKDAVFQKLVELSKKISIVFGFVYESKNNLFYNAAAYLEDGKCLHIHRKVYLPDYTMFEEARYFAAGDRFVAFDSKFGKCGLLVCEDAMHQSSSYILSQSGVQNIFVLTNSPARGVGGHGHEASETWHVSNRYTSTLLTVNMIFVNRVGVEDGVVFWGGSEVYDATGKNLIRLGYFEEEFKCVDISDDSIRRARIATPYIRDEKLFIMKKFIEKAEGHNEA